jgi:hypothetical protein
LQAVQAILQHNSLYLDFDTAFVQDWLNAVLLPCLISPSSGAFPFPSLSSSSSLASIASDVLLSWVRVSDTMADCAWICAGQHIALQRLFIDRVGVDDAQVCPFILYIRIGSYSLYQLFI